MIRVVLVDDQELVRAGFRMVLDAQDDIEVVGEAGDGEPALRLLAATPADVVLMDVRMPRMDGIEATRRITGTRAGPRVIILTTFDMDEYAFAAIKAGAAGFLLKDAGPAQLIAAIRAVHSGDAVVAPSTTRRLLDRFAVHLPGKEDKALDAVKGLTGRELDVLLLVARGLSNAEVAARLHLSEATVKTHLGRLFTKLGLRDRVQAVVLAYETGLVKTGQLQRPE
ncbi:response regulator transcription factor [Actinomadura rayongensis]|uniref:Response regulator n=1 Tax=Actinomadura rayongensis TaxID=1429076 RepID=A0A6I4W996_9ACTN|nr:response regulator transcription factor [Actinomadura rayongensis]MXQ66747.1 response regulator [Actinomadura rayongensis]